MFWIRFVNSRWLGYGPFGSQEDAQAFMLTQPEYGPWYIIGACAQCGRPDIEERDVAERHRASHE